MNAALLSLVIFLPTAFDAEGRPAAGTQWTYRGGVSEVKRDRPPAPQASKSFDLTLIVAESGENGTHLYWIVDERGQGAWPWLERFGRLSLDPHGKAIGPVGPALLYDYGAGKSVIALLPPLLIPPEELAGGKSWEQDGLKYEVDGPKRVAEHDTWQVGAESNLGPKRTVWVDKDTPLVVGFDERVFMDRGTEFQLSARLVGSEELSADDLQATRKAFEQLIALRTRLKRPARTQADELTPEQRSMAANELARLEPTVTFGPLAKLVRTASRETQAQSGRAEAVAQLSSQQIGKAVEKFTVESLTGKQFSESDLPNRVTVLHFWDYRDEPLKEPYGQVGYLEFLHNRRKGDGVDVYGVAVDGRLQNEQTRKAAMNSIRKLRNFMNLTYPVLLDDGILVKQFGDPRSVGVNLPLFVVIGPDSTIVHHHVGFYPVDRQEGLKELDALVAELLEKPAAADAPAAEKPGER
jgi:hypothetical protein